ncbi:NEAT domain-containing protein [Paenibacillus sp. EKM11P]|uniref:NEAT domain-containing protein n=1 Tax=Paenibacillus sp. EKM11P TaxID=2708057 RepID=UPI00142E79E4|nr:NEAT domain-containing protein [Paenibacillus sp. EKM11P]KAF6644858.1 NEAT domain-containing protein [Paenibacillus sp. EKM11P]
MKRQFKKYLMTFVAIIMLLSVVFPFAPTASASDETNPSIESSVSESSVTQDVYSVEPSPVEVIPTEDVASTYTVAAVETPSSSIMQDSNVYSINYVVKNESKASGVGISPYNDMFLKPATFTVEQDTYHVSLILDNPNTPFTDIEFKQNGENVPAHISDLVKGDKTYEPRTVTFDVYNLDQKIDVNYIYNNRLRQNWIEFDPSTIAVKEGSVTPPTPSPEPEVPLKPGVLNFTILKDKSEEVSVMDGYALKPAKLVQKGDKWYIQLTFNYSSWIPSFQTEQNGKFVEAATISEVSDANQRTVEFEVNNLSNSLNAYTHVIVPGLELGGVPYDHWYHVQIKFDTSITPDPSTPPTLADGTYAINFNTLHATKDQPSTMAQYLLSPATLTVAKGQKEVSFTIKDSTTVTEFKTEQNGTLTDADIVSEDKTANTRVVKFKVADLDAILNAQVHVSTTYPGGVYEMDHKLRLQFDKNSITNAPTPVDPGTPGTPGTPGKNLADGTYSINFDALHATKDQKSAMAQYLLSPATLTVSKGKYEASFTIKDSTTVTEFKTEQNGTLTDADIVSEDKNANTRVVKFKVANLDAILNAQVHVSTTYPGGVYEMDHKLRLQFDRSSVTAKGPDNGTTTPVENGRYSIDFSVLKNGSNEISVMDGYMQKPATLLKQSGKNIIQIKMDKSSWIKTFKVNGSEAQVVEQSTSADTRTVQFEVPNLSDKVTVNTHVIVPGLDLGGIPYDHVYDVQFQFEPATIRSFVEPTSSGAADPIVKLDFDKLANGKYALKFTIVLPDGITGSESPAQRFITNEPAQLVVEGDKRFVGLKLQNSNEVKALRIWDNASGGYQDAEVTREDAASNTKDVRFSVSDFKNNVKGQLVVYEAPKVASSAPMVFKAEDRVEKVYDFEFKFDTSNVSYHNETKADEVEQGKNNLADGEYTANFRVLANGTDKDSLVAPFVQSLAKLIVKNGKVQAHVTVTDNQALKLFQTDFEGRYANPTIVGTDTKGDTHTIAFEVPDLDKKLSVYTQVYLPEKYIFNEKFGGQIQFDRASLKGEGVNVATTATATESAAASTDKATETTTSVAEAKPAVEQPVQPASEKQYTINYNVFKDKTNEASVMDGYLDKPATLIEKGDKRYIQITLKNSSWMPTLQVEQNGTLKDVEVISTSGDTRIVQFEVGDLSQKISAYTHVIVPGLVLGGVPYDHWYTVQFQFDEASLKVK